MPRRFVSVFYNGPKWVDNIDACVEQGNTFSGVSFYDWTSTEEVDEYGNKKVSAMTEFFPTTSAPDAGGSGRISLSRGVKSSN